MPTNVARRLPLLAGLLALAGCGGDPTGRVSGRVTLDGSPLTAGSVNLLVAGVAYPGDIQADGRYEVSEVPVGEAVVLVFDPPDEAAAAQLDKEQLEKWRQANLPPPLPKAKPKVVPAVYGDPLTSPLKTTVSGGSNRFDIALKK